MMSKQLWAAILTAAFTCAMGLAGCAAGVATPRESGEKQPARHDTRHHDPSTTGTEPDQHLPDMTVEEYERLGDTYVRQGNWTMAFLQYDKALRLAPEQSRLQYKKSLLYLGNGLPRDAQEAFQAIVRDNPRHALAWEGLGRAYFLSGQHQQAFEALTRALRENPRLWRSRELRGILYDYQQQHERAITEYQGALAIKPDAPQLHHNLGRSFYLTGRYRAAIRSFEHALAHGSSDPRTYNNLGLAFSKEGAYREAWNAFRKGGTEVQAFTNLGVVYLEAGKPAKAMACLKKALDASPAFPAKASEHLAFAESQLGTEQVHRGQAPVQADTVCF